MRAGRNRAREATVETMSKQALQSAYRTLCRRMARGEVSGPKWEKLADALVAELNTRP